VDVFRLLQLLIGMVTAGAAIVGAREPVHVRPEHPQPSGTIRFDPVVSSTGSDGTLHYGGKAYRLPSVCRA